MLFKLKRIVDSTRVKSYRTGIYIRINILHPFSLILAREFTTQEEGNKRNRQKRKGERQRGRSGTKIPDVARTGEHRR